MLTNSVRSEIDNDEQKTMQQKLADAEHQIEDLKLQIAWLERSYE